MCGRYASSRQPEDLVEEFEIREHRAAAPGARLQRGADQGGLRRRRAPARPSGRAGVRRRERQLRVLRWGLVPSWAKDPSIGNRMINARMETVAEKPAFKRAFAKRRCILPADGYFEWYTTEEHQGGQAAQAAVLHPPGRRRRAGDGRALRDLARPGQGRGRPDAVPVDLHGAHHQRRGLLGHIHDRMPLLVEPERYDAWLDPRSDDPTTCWRCWCRPRPAGWRRTRSRRWSTTCKNNGPELVDPLPLEDLADVPEEGSA